MAVAIIDTKEYLTCAEAAGIISRRTGDEISPISIRVYCNNEAAGRSPSMHATKVGRDWLIHRDEVKRFCDNRRGPGRPNGE